jgi:ubiquinone/menaquinone biosynthesis C-methylase UbiE
MNTAAATTTAPPGQASAGHIDLEALKSRQQVAWSSGDYALIGTTLQIVGEQLCEAVDLRAGEKVLDVAAGNGNASLAAARRGADVVATDYVGHLLEKAAARAAAEGLPLATEIADVEALPYEDASFDTVLSTLGVMFAPNPERSSAEMLRVVRPGGRIGLANWTPEGFIGQLFKVVGAHVPPPAGVPSPLQWGTDARLEELFGGSADVAITRKHFTFRYRSAEDMFGTFITYYGPTHKAWGALEEDGRTSFKDQMLALMDGANRSATALAVDSEYLEVVITKR